MSTNDNPQRIGACIVESSALGKVDSGPALRSTWVMGAAFFFAVAAVVAIAAVLSKRVRARGRERRWEKLPGHSVATALGVERFDEIDHVVDRARCLCGGILERRSEGSREVGERTVRVVKTECARCEDERMLFFIVEDRLN